MLIKVFEIKIPVNIIIKAKNIVFSRITMSFYPLFMIVFSMSFLSVSVPISFSIENLDKSLSYAEKNCDNESCTVTTCFEDTPCSITY